MHRARHGAGQEVEGSWGPLARTSEGSCILAFGLLLPSLREGNGAGPFPAARRLFVANKLLGDGTAFGGRWWWPTLSGPRRGRTFKSTLKQRSGHFGGTVHKSS